MNQADKKDLGEVLSAIRAMVRDETRGKSDRIKKETLSKISEKPEVTTSSAKGNLPAKVIVLKPHMRVYSGKPKVMVLEKSARVHSSQTDNAGYSVESPSIYEGMLREIVREVVQEQLRGEIGTEIINAIKRDMVQALEKKSLN